MCWKTRNPESFRLCAFATSGNLVHNRVIRKAPPRLSRGENSIGIPNSRLSGNCQPFVTPYNRHPQAAGGSHD